MLSPQAKRNIARVIPFGVLWALFSLIYCVLEKGILGDLRQYPSTGNQYDFGRNIVGIPLAGGMMGILTGILETCYFSTWFIKKSFATKILFKSLIYLAILFIFLVLLLLFNARDAHGGQSLGNLTSPAIAFFTSAAAIGLILYMTAVVAITQFYAEISQRIGPGTLNNFFAGKYHHPIQEERIFMFLDMKSSTTIAESLGHVVYFKLLKEYFFDLSGAVLDYAGTIYQYAGDEMIISWSLKDGVRRNNCIACFFAMKRALENGSEKYKSTFGIVPTFKAGLHAGAVTAGEIGSLKKEIIFTGDVLNTAARIEGLCNHFGADLLVSKDLVDILRLPDPYVAKSVGESVLKGRKESMELFAVSSAAG